MSKKILSISLAFLTLFLVLGSEARAADTVITIGQDEVIEGPYLNVGETVTISGTINGDAYIGGGIVTVDGTINGDLIVGGGAVTIKGVVSDDVRAGGGMVTIDGRVGKNVTAFGGSIIFGSDADIKGSVLVGGGTVTHMGNISGKALIYCSELTLAGRVGGNVTTAAEKITVTKTALLDGNLDYTADEDALVSEEAKITGVVQKTAAGKALTKAIPTTRPGAVGLRFGFQLLAYFSMLLLGLVLLKIAPRQAAAVSKLIGEQPWQSMGLGFLSLALVPIAIVILMITVIGVPLALLLGGLYILMIWLSSLFTGLFIGQKIFGWVNLKENSYAMMAVGLLILQLIFALPVLGVFTRILSVLLAMGALLTLQREALKKLELRK